MCRPTYRSKANRAGTGACPYDQDRIVFVRANPMSPSDKGGRTHRSAPTNKCVLWCQILLGNPLKNRLWFVGVDLCVDPRIDPRQTGQARGPAPTSRRRSLCREGDYCDRRCIRASTRSPLRTIGEAGFMGMRGCPPRRTGSRTPLRRKSGRICTEGLVWPSRLFRVDTQVDPYEPSRSLCGEGDYCDRRCIRVSTRSPLRDEGNLHVLPVLGGARHVGQAGARPCIGTKKECASAYPFIQNWSMIVTIFPAIKNPRRKTTAGGFISRDVKKTKWSGRSRTSDRRYPSGTARYNPDTSSTDTGP